MSNQEVAASNLQQFSQNTQYIFDWNNPVPSKGHSRQPKTQQKKELFQIKTGTQKSKKGEQRAKKEKEQSQRYRQIRQKHQEVRMDRLSRFEFPILGDAKGNTKQKWKEVIDGIVNEEFRRMNKQICDSLLNQRQQRLSKQLLTYHSSGSHHQLFSHKLPKLRSAKSLSKLNSPVMLIDQNQSKMIRKSSVQGLTLQKRHF